MTFWIGSVPKKKDDSKDPTGVFKKVDQLLPEKPRLKPQDRARDIEAALCASVLLSKEAKYFAISEGETKSPLIDTGDLLRFAIQRQPYELLNKGIWWLNRLRHQAT